MHADLAPANILVCDGGSWYSTSRWRAAAHTSTTSRGCSCRSTCCARSRSFGTRHRDALQSALLRGLDPALTPDHPLFRFLSMLHRVNHLGTLALRRERFPVQPPQRERPRLASALDRGRAARRSVA